MLVNKRITIMTILILSACTVAEENMSSPVKITAAFPELSFVRPVDFQHAPDDSNWLYVVEQAGCIYKFENIENVSEKKLFLDITDRVNNWGNEEGLLGLAFDPNFKNNRYLYVDYTAAQPRRTIISRFTVDKQTLTADKSSEYLILEIEQPYSNHNGGQISFGPDGYLYIAMGDGGSAGDPQGNGQNRQTLLGSILRIDVSNSGSDIPYKIPADNPFVGNNDGFREEIYAYGLRNPWRFSFDNVSDELWAADVGQNKIEEIDIIKKGENYGWNILEGMHCYDPPQNCSKANLTLPVHEYNHSEGLSITGGFIYRGQRVRQIYGHYIYADYVTGKIWALSRNEDQFANRLIANSGLNISSFGIDKNNELYFCAFDGKIYKFE